MGHLDQISSLLKLSVLLQGSNIPAPLSNQNTLASFHDPFASLASSNSIDSFELSNVFGALGSLLSEDMSTVSSKSAFSVPADNRQTEHKSSSEGLFQLSLLLILSALMKGTFSKLAPSWGQGSLAGRTLRPLYPSSFSNGQAGIKASQNSFGNTNQKGLASKGMQMGSLTKALELAPDYNSYVNQIGKAAANSACGVVAAASLLNFHGKGNASMSQLLQEAKGQGWTQGAGMGRDGIKNILGKRGVHMQDVAANKQVAINQLRQGKPVVIHLEGHYVVASGYNESTGEFYLGRTSTVVGGKPWVRWQDMPNIPYCGAHKGMLI